jgi:DNA-binding IclR family transcriptional regulator
MSAPGGARRVVAVLEAFLDGVPDLGVTELSRRLDCSKSVVHRILAALTERGFVVADPATHRYRLGPNARRLGDVASEHQDLGAQALPHLRRIRERTGETATFSARRGAVRVYVEQVESRHVVRQTVRVGEEAPLHLGASGKAILAFLPESAWPSGAGGAALGADLRRIRRRGYATSQGERIPGAASVAAPVFDRDGSVIGSISVAGVVVRTEARQTAVYGSIVQTEADALSRKLGWLAGRPAGRQRGRRAFTA